MVQGVALELLCRLLFTEGSNPSLSLPSPNVPVLLTIMYQIAIDTIIPTVRLFFDINSFYISNFCGIENIETGKSRQAKKYPC